jgi:hypothetical protein
MPETIAREVFGLAAIEALEDAIEARLGWIDTAISPFAIASRNALGNETLAQTPALLAPRTGHVNEELQLAG